MKYIQFKRKIRRNFPDIYKHIFKPTAKVIDMENAVVKIGKEMILLHPIIKKMWIKDFGHRVFLSQKVRPDVDYRRKNYKKGFQKRNRQMVYNWIEDNIELIRTRINFSEL